MSANYSEAREICEYIGYWLYHFLSNRMAEIDLTGFSLYNFEHLRLHQK